MHSLIIFLNQVCHGIFKPLLVFSMKLLVLCLIPFCSTIGGHADGSVKLISPDGAKTIESASGHLAPVTCLALSPDSNYLVTGSRDSTVILWRIHKPGSIHKKNPPEPPPSTPRTPRSPLPSSPSNISNLLETRKCRIEGPMHVLRGHLGEVISCSVSPDLGLVVSLSNISGVLLHSLRTGRLIRKIHVAEAHAVSLSSQGIILVWSELKKILSSFTVNGLPIATSVLSPFSGRVSCIQISMDGHFALIGTCSSSNYKCEDNTDSADHETDKPSGKGYISEQIETGQSVHVPSICFVDLHKLKVNKQKKLKTKLSIYLVFLCVELLQRHFLARYFIPWSWERAKTSQQSL